jgi:hypothetical protein
MAAVLAAAARNFRLKAFFFFLRRGPAMPLFYMEIIRIGLKGAKKAPKRGLFCRKVF